MIPADFTERAARNETIFRELNDHLGAATGGSPTDERGFVCECADMSCTEVLTVPLGEYEKLRRDPQRFLVASGSGHVDMAVERVVERRNGYWIVEKLAVADEIAEDDDPRSLEVGRPELAQPAPCNQST